VSGRDATLLKNRCLQPTEVACQQIDSFPVQHALAMKTKLKRLAIRGVAGLIAVMPLAARADDDNDHDLARDLYEQGEIHRLSDILQIVGEQAPGDVVAVDLIQLDHKWVYRFQIVAADGRRMFVDVDAGAATVIHDGAGER
jgi:uncharacterized membrane protein YkoI